ncbi:hypothetical protein [Granulicella sp. L56]|uniref:hypothetical protein n=1 Tax=Granulicella sp. L56 TaxID=1747222 RepID=UPI00131E5D0B|nr:hypothetical protein [Granulicella sp. L56]
MAYFLLAAFWQAPSHHKVFVIDKVTQVSTASNKALGTQGQLVQQEHHSAPVVMAEFAKKCPAISFTEDQSGADFILQTQPGGSTLADPKGNILYVSPAKNLGNMVKDVCKFVSSR